MKNYHVQLLYFLVFFIFGNSYCQSMTINSVEFKHLDTNNGISNSQVNYIFKDAQGFIWFATEAGLDRYDGFRLKVFKFRSDDKSSLPSDQVYKIQEDAIGNLWVNTAQGYCIYNPITETFDRELAVWMQKHGMRGTPDNVLVDKNKNMWIAIYGKGCYFYDVHTNRSFLFSENRNQLPHGNVTGMTEVGNTVVLSYNDGTLVRIDGNAHKILWINKTIAVRNKQVIEPYKTYVDREGNYWVTTNALSLIYDVKEKKWYDSLPEFLRHLGITCPWQNVLIKDIAEDKNGRLLIATDHNGLILVDLNKREIENYIYDKSDVGSIPDNTLQCVFVDNSSDALWIGTYKNGVAYYSSLSSRFGLIPVGDVCTITQDKNGLFWFGTNDSGILSYNPITGESVNYRMGETGLGSDIVVSSLSAHDGSLWFGTYEGGLARYKDGHFSVYRADGKPNSLANDCVWSLAEDRNGNILIGTLGSGLQILNPTTGSFQTFNVNNANLPSDYISSVNVDNHGNYVFGHSQHFSVMDARTHKVVTYSKTRSGQQFSSPSVNQIFVDSRGIIWNATTSGMNVYDPTTDQYELFDATHGGIGQMACSVVEDNEHSVWIAFDHGVSRVKVSKKDGKWDFFITNYNDFDGLQSRQFNFRSIFLSRNGDVFVGGQDGVNIIPPQNVKTQDSNAKVLFSELVLFDHPISVGEEYNNRVILDEAINSSRVLELNNDEDAFTIQLASSIVAVPQKCRFLYRLKGFNDDKWMMTAESQPNVTYTGLSAGTYELEVKVVNRDGSIGKDVSSMKIIINPPFYLSIWAFMIYLFIFMLAAYYSRQFIIRRQQAKFELQQIEDEAKRTKEMDEMKLTFYTNISHELRTPLTLIISPLAEMIRKERDKENCDRLKLIHRNAIRLLTMVNQLLDFRKVEKQRMQLNLMTGDMVAFVRNICNSFKLLTDKKLNQKFSSDVDQLFMSFDEDKFGKIINNLLSNAYKFTPEEGEVSIHINTYEEEMDADNRREMLMIRVADTGRGISDEDKKHIFDRFYQVKEQTPQPFGGSGVGLNLVKEFIMMHDGTVTVEDNPDGGTVFILRLPVRHDESLDVIEPGTEIPYDYVVSDVSEQKKDNQGNIDNTQLSEIEQVKAGHYEVLIVDDSEDFLQFMGDVLSEIYVVRKAHNGKEALKMIEEHKPDVILSDVMMPVMDGNELCRMIKGNPKTERIPFVMLTARLADEHKIAGMENGADDYITKPFNLDLLNLRICNLIKWRNATPLGVKVDPQVKVEEITSVDEKLVKDATEYVEQHLDDTTVSVETMSDVLNMSRVHLYKRLLSVTGNTPSEFIRLIRLRHAEQLLRESQMSVSEVAYKVGFNNPRYFSKYFKEMYGVMPSQYKRN